MKGLKSIKEENLTLYVFKKQKKEKKQKNNNLQQKKNEYCLGYKGQTSEKKYFL